MTPSPSPRWYAVHTKPGAEMIARDALRERDYEVFLPHHVVTIRHARRTRTVSRALYPRYLFAAVAPDQSFAGVNYAPGVSVVVHGPDGPLEIPTPVIAAERSKCSATGLVIEPECVLVRGGRFRPGDRIRIGNGHLSGFWATVRAVDNGGALRIWLETARGWRAASVPAEAVNAA